MGEVLTPELARASIGRQVMNHSTSLNGRPRAVQLTRVVSDTLCEVLPPGHKKYELVPMSDLRYWSKGMAKAPARTPPNGEQQRESSPEVRDFRAHAIDAERAREWMNRGVRPLVRYIAGEARNIHTARFIGMREGDILIKTKAGNFDIRRPCADVAYYEEDQPKAAAVKPPPTEPTPKPVTTTVIVSKPKEPTPMIATATPSSAKRETFDSRGPWLIMLPEQRLFWCGSLKRWRKDVKEAKKYDIEHKAQMVVTRLVRDGELESQRLGNATLTIEGLKRAEWLFNEQWYRPAAAIAPEPAPSPAPAAASITEAAPAAALVPAAAKQDYEPTASPLAPIMFTVASKPATTPDALFDAWAHARRERMDAEALLSETRSKEARADMELEISLRRKALSL